MTDTAVQNRLRSSGEQFAGVGEIELCYETFGEEQAEPLLLVMGLAAQMVLWEDEFCAQLAGRGFRVIRFDNRDIGRSTILRHLPVPTRGQLLRRDRRAGAYTLSDMASDAAGLLDHLGIDSAHVVGASMGGMIVQRMAIDHPARVRSLVSIMSTTGNRRVGRPHPRLLPVLLRRARTDRAGYIQDFVNGHRLIGSRAHPPDPSTLRALAELCFERGVHPAGVARQLGAIVTTEDRTPLLARVSVPATVIHGEADQLVRPSGGKATARAIPGARLVMVPGMAHDLPRPLWGQLIDEIAATAQRAGRR